MSTLTRRLTVIAGFLILGGAGVAFYFMRQMKEPPKQKAAVEKRRNVDTMVVYNGPVPASLPVQGELIAYDKIDIFSEVSGTLSRTRRPFKVGAYFPKGSVLIEIDREEARLSLLSQKSTFLNTVTQLMPDLKIDYPESFGQWRDYLDSFNIEKPLPPLPEPVNRQEKRFIASRNLYTQYYNIKSAEERLSKYTVRAPFSGVLTEAAINPGAVVRAGQNLGTLMNNSNYELEATVPLSELKYIEEGNTVILTSDDVEGEWRGRIRRVNDRVDPNTQTVSVFVGVSGTDLREGMYLRGEVTATEIEQAVALPRRMLVDQQAVYLVRDSVLRLKEVTVLKVNPETVVVRGLKDGTPLLREPFPGAFDGMKVQIREAEGNGTAASSNAGAVGMR